MSRETQEQVGAAMKEMAALFSPGHVEALRELGHDFLEGRREGSLLWDTQGRRFIDCSSGSATFNLGRAAAPVLAELRKAMRETDQGNFPMISTEKADLARALAEFTPGHLGCVVFSVHRGETVEFACKLARGVTGRQELLTFDGGHFGETGFALSLSERDDRDDFEPLMPGIRVLPFGDEAAIAESITERTAAVIVEPLQAENHCRRVEERTLRLLRRRCTRKGAALILDETQTGLGRTGRRFACEHAGVVPDALILGEALGAGVFPIAATVFTPQLNLFLNEHPLIHLSTFGGSDLGCRVAARALELYRSEQPWIAAERIGGFLRTGLQRIAQARPGVIRSVAGLGLLLSLDLRTPERARTYCREAASRGVLVVPGRVARHTVVLRPSLTISEDEVSETVEALAAVAGGLASQGDG